MGVWLLEGPTPNGCSCVHRNARLTVHGRRTVIDRVSGQRGPEAPWPRKMGCLAQDGRAPGGRFETGWSPASPTAADDRSEVRLPAGGTCTQGAPRRSPRYGSRSAPGFQRSWARFASIRGSPAALARWSLVGVPPETSCESLRQGQSTSGLPGLGVATVWVPETRLTSRGLLIFVKETPSRLCRGTWWSRSGGVGEYT